MILPAWATGWWQKQNRSYSLAERIADAIVHGVGLVTALVFGAIMLGFNQGLASGEHAALLVYLGSLVVLLCVSLAFNQLPRTPFKQFMARFDQAAIFLFIAGTYTPFLTVMGGTPFAGLLMALIWGGALIGIALKLIVPDHFGRIAIVLYLAIGWSGILVFQSLAATLPATALWLVLAGGVAYSCGIIFHLWEKLRFQNVIWHVFVVAGATMHLVAVLDMMVLSRVAVAT